MKIAIRYHSVSGNTKKLAASISSVIGVEAKPVSEPLREDVDILFLGTAPHAFDVDDEVKAFINDISVSVGKAVIFSTSAAVKSIRKYVEKLFVEKKISLVKEEFSCRGSFGLLHKGRPNEQDRRAAADFAAKIIS